MNTAILMGRLTRDPEITEFESGMLLATYTLAVDRQFVKEGQPEADFIRCKVFGKGAEFADKWLKKGIKVAIRGRIETGSYEREDGTKVYTTDIIVESQEFAESKRKDEAEAKPEKKTYKKR